MTGRWHLVHTLAVLTTPEIVASIGIGYSMGLALWAIGAVFAAVRGAVRSAETA
jgi:hypothetical protein